MSNKRLSRKQKIEAILDDVDNWDLDTLIDSVKYSLEKELNQYSTKELTKEYRMCTDPNYIPTQRKDNQNV